MVITTSQPEARRHASFPFVLAVGFVYGAVYNFLPVTFPIFRQEFQATLEQLGRTQFVFLISSLLVSVTAGGLVIRLGLKRVVAVSLLLLASGLAAIGAAADYSQLLAGCFLFGIAVATLVVGASSLITAGFSERRQSVFFAFGMADAVGAIAGPALVGPWTGEAGTWRIAYWIVAAIMVLMALWATRLPEVAAGGSSEEGVMHAMGAILRSPAIYLIGAAMFCHGIAQVGMTSWIGEFFREAHGISPAEAAWFLSINSAGFLVGRSLLGVVTARRPMPELVVLGVCAFAGTLAFALTLAAPSLYVGWCMFGIAGFFISGNAPSINSFVGRNWPVHTATAFAILSGLGNIGGAAGPYVTGLIGGRVGIERGISIMPLFSLALAGLSLGWYLVRRRARVAVEATATT